MRSKVRLTIFFLVLFLVSVSISQNNPKILDWKIIAGQDKLSPGKSVQIALELDIHPPWHINAHKPNEDFLIPTVVEFSPAEGVAFGRIQYPPGVNKTFEFSETPLRVYEGTVYLITSVSIDPSFRPSEATIAGKLTFQACNDHICLAPQEIVFSRKLPVASAGEPTKVINQSVFLPQNDAGPSSPGKAAGGGSLGDKIRAGGFLLTILTIFGAGLALNLTPCVYPLIPITISYFGGQAGGKKGSILAHAILYVLGMSLTYSVLGVFAALSGNILGAWLQNPVVLIFIALVMVVLAMSMFGLYEIRVPSGLATFAGRSKGGYAGTVFMGLTVGIVAAPCIGPFVLALLTYVGERGDPFMGFWMFFVLSLGLGAPFIVLALFSGSLNKMPRSGSWMIWVRKIFGFILIGVALYFLEPLIHSALLYYTALAVTSLIAGIYLAWIDRVENASKTFVLVRSLIGLAFIAAGIFFWTYSVETYVNAQISEATLAGGQTAQNAIQWQPYDASLLANAKARQRPVMIDFFAEWCIPCKELDKFTFTDQRVVKFSRNFEMLKADLTKNDSPQVQKLKQQFQIKGVPTLVFLSAAGEEIPDSRVVGFVDADKFIIHLKTVLAASDSSLVKR